MVFVKLSELARAKWPPRLALLSFFSSLLSSPGAPLPALPAAQDDAAALRALAAAACGAGSALGGEAFGSALLRAGLAPPGLTPAERAAVCFGGAAAAGVASLAVARSGPLCAAADAAAALSAEALRASTSPFDAASSGCEANGGGHAGEAAVGAHIVALLDGSGRVNPRKGGATPPCLSSVPQVHGAARDAVAAARRAARGALASCAPGAPPATAKPPPPGSPNPAVGVAMGQLAAALAGAGRSSCERAAAVDAAAPAPSHASRPPRAAAAAAAAAACASESASACAVVALLAAATTSAGAAPQPSLEAACAAAHALRSLAHALAEEMAAASAALDDADASPAVDAGARAAKPQKQQPAGDASAAPPAPAAPAAAAMGRGTRLVRTFASALGDSRSPLSPDDAALATLLESLKKEAEANASRRKPKLAKGTRDFLPEQMALRERAFATIVAVFKRHGAVALDTPVFELRETLTGKYGEDSKLIYDLADQGGEALSLRYDLTVPFARYLAMHSVGNIKRYHIARVYRRDNPAMARGRFREFYQCDFDIAGAYPAMTADAEVLAALVEVLSDLKVGSFEVKLNHRRLLDAAFAVAGVPPHKFRSICSAVDKLDKESWEEVRREMVEDKGLEPGVADAVGRLVTLKAPLGSPHELLAQLAGEASPFAGHAGAAAALSELGTLFSFLAAMGALPRIAFDLSLARGLDYYTGVSAWGARVVQSLFDVSPANASFLSPPLPAVFEAVLTGGTGGVGSIAAGGRYDTLVGMFSGKSVPCCGVSIGVERVFTLMEHQAAAAGGGGVRATCTSVLVATVGKDLSTERMALAAHLWAAGLGAEFSYAASPNMAKQLQHALETGIPLVATLGEDELAAGTVTLKRLADKREETMPRDRLVAAVREWLGQAPGGDAPLPVVVS